MAARIRHLPAWRGSESVPGQFYCSKLKFPSFLCDPSVGVIQIEGGEGYLFTTSVGRTKVAARDHPHSGEQRECEDEIPIALHRVPPM